MSLVSLKPQPHWPVGNTASLETVAFCPPPPCLVLRDEVVCIPITPSTHAWCSGVLVFSPLPGPTMDYVTANQGIRMLLICDTEWSLIL